MAAQSYEYCVAHFVYDNELDVVRDIIRHMPDFIEMRVVGGRAHWFIWNETTSGENFAEKWNNDPRRAEAFFAWHARATADLDGLAGVEGLDRLNKSLSESFGRALVTKAFDALTEEVSSARRTSRLSVAPVVGLAFPAAQRPRRLRAPQYFLRRAIARCGSASLTADGGAAVSEPARESHLRRNRDSCAPAG